MNYTPAFIIILIINENCYNSTAISLRDSGLRCNNCDVIIQFSVTLIVGGINVFSHNSVDIA